MYTLQLSAHYVCSLQIALKAAHAPLAASALLKATVRGCIAD